jgi:hypothetical protein
MRIVPPFGAANGLAATSSDPSKTAAAASDPGSCALVAMLVRVPRVSLTPSSCTTSRIDAYDRSMTDRTPRRVELRLDLTDAELGELERALLKARATELGEVRRRQIRLSAGYGDATTREAMDDEADRAQLRYDALSRLIKALQGPRE